MSSWPDRVGADVAEGSAHRAVQSSERAKRYAMSVHPSPFEHVRPLAPEQVSGRDAESAALVRRIRERKIVAVVAPRRFGKTSLVDRALALADDVDPTPWQVSVDLFGLSSAFDLAVRLERAMGRIGGGHRRRIADRLAGSELGLSLAPGVGVKAKLGARDAPDPVQALHELLAALTEAAESHGGGVLFLDEFQDLADVAGLDAILRSHLQRARDVAVLFAGSQPSFMRSLFSDRARAFYAQAELFELGPLSGAAAHELVITGFDSTGRDASMVADRMVSFTGGHPQRLMLLADMVWEATPDGASAGATELAAGLDAARAATAPEFEAVWRRLPEGSRDVLRSVVRFGSPAARAGERFLDLTAGSAATAARSLVADSVLVRDGVGGRTHWGFVDPFFADWVDRTLP